MKKMAKIIRIIFFLMLIGCILGMKPFEIVEDLPSLLKKEIFGFDANAQYEPLEFDTNRYYYEQLNETEKAIYEAFANNKESFLNNEDIYCLSYDLGEDEKYQEYFRKARRAFWLDNPETKVYFQSTYKRTYTSSNCKKLYVVPDAETGRYSCFESDEIRSVLLDLEMRAKALVDSFPEGYTDLDKLVSIHNWIIENVEYASDVLDVTDESDVPPNPQSIYGAMVEGKALCGGFAYTFKYIADMAGLDVLYVYGVSVLEDGERVPHAWNLVYIYGEWRHVDVTYDNSCYNAGLDRYSFFLDNNASTTYVPDDKFVYPNLN